MAPVQARGPGQSWHSRAPWCGPWRGSPGGKPTPWLAVNSRAGVAGPPSRAPRRAFVAPAPSAVSTAHPWRAAAKRSARGATSSVALRRVARSSAFWAPKNAARGGAGERRRARRPALRGDDAAGVAGVLLGGGEVQAPHGVLHVQLVLEGPGDRLRPPHQQQVVGHPAGVGRARSRPVAGQEGSLALPRAVAVRAGELAVVALVCGPGLGLAVGQQLPQGLPHGGVGVVGEDHPPPRLGQVPGVDPLRRPPPAGGIQEVPVPVAQVFAVGPALLASREGAAGEPFPAGHAGHLAGGEGGQEVAPAGAVDAVTG